MTEIKKPELDNETLGEIGRVVLSSFPSANLGAATRPLTARAALDLLHPHYVAANQDDDWETVTSAEDIRKGDTVERVRTSSDGTTLTTVGVARELDTHGDWRTEGDNLLTHFGDPNCTHRVRRAHRPELPTEAGARIVVTIDDEEIMITKTKAGAWRGFDSSGLAVVFFNAAFDDMDWRPWRGEVPAP